MTAAEVVANMESLQDDEQRQNLMRFFKTGPGEYGEGDEFLGLKVPQTREVVKALGQDFPLSEVPELLMSRWHEVRLCGLLILVARFEKLSMKRLENDETAITVRDEILTMYLKYAEQANNWDLVDLSAPKILGYWLLLPSHLGNRDYKMGILDALAASDNLWRQRMSMVCTWKTSQMGDPSWCLRYAEIHLHHPHDLMHKAVGWMLREMGKRCSMDLLRDFLRQHAAEMPRTTLRYAIEKMAEHERQYWMNGMRETIQRMTDKITEQPSHFDHLEQMTVLELLQHINEEDALVAEAVRKAIPQIKALVEAIEPRMKRGGRLFYVGAGTSGRLGVLDASELPPTFGIADTWVVGIIAGGDRALRHAVEKAEDHAEQGWSDMMAYHPTKDDTVIGIAASGTTPYVVGAVSEARKNGLLTGCITSNHHTPLADAVDFPIKTIVGPEFVTGSSRMKSGTAQKMVLNMISTSLMIRLGRVEGNRMVKMQLTNAKLVDRGTRMIQESLGLSYEEARQRLLEAGSVDGALR